MLAQDVARRMEEEHAIVDRLVRGLREWLAALPRSNFARWIDGARQRFDHFRAHLIRHFAEEERDGYMRLLAGVHPIVTAEVERLRREHGEMIRLLEAMHRDLQALTPEDRLLIQDAGGRMERFLAILEHHEHEEHLLAALATAGEVKA